ncbi:P-loop containing nucleoside triphosphate hydrolase protein, partial [Mycena leptocephala]
LLVPLQAYFPRGDMTFDWVYSYMECQQVWNHSRTFSVIARDTAKIKDRDVQFKSGDGYLDAVYEPSSWSPELFHWKKQHWITLFRLCRIHFFSQQTTSSPRHTGSQISILIHSCDKSVLLDFIEAARLQYREASISRVNVHLTDGYENWGRVISKSRRSFSTLILPDGIKETLLSDIKEFLDSEEWYKFAGVPHRRGYLLFGEPGTGKSTSIHALAGELGMEIYFISLAAPGINNHSLGELFHSTPPNSILLIEDIDCAFPLRVDISAEIETQVAQDGRPNEILRPRSQVTLAGLLNILDSVASQEGRILIATTNHIEQLDTALIRPGRIDLKIKYSLATTEQLKNVFHRFYPVSNSAKPGRIKGDPLTAAEVDDLAHQFATAVPHSKYSIAQLQGYLLGWKNDPKGAVQGISAWIAERELEVTHPAKYGRR